MVQGLAFLSKKSWHTKNFANQEKVWVAEEKKRAEEQKTKELAKQIQQEREEEELAKVAGIQRKTDRGIDWMYEGGHAQSQLAKEDAQKEAEEFLLGKAYSSNAVAGHFQAENTTEGIHAVLTKPPEDEKAAPAAATISRDVGSAATHQVIEGQEPSSVHDRNEAFRMRHEDPMFAVCQITRENQQKYEQKKALYERVTGRTAVAYPTNEPKRKSKKEKKSEKDKKRKRKRGRSPPSDDDRDRRRSRRGSRARSTSEDSRYNSASDFSSVSSSSRNYHRRQRSRSPDERRRRRRSRSRSPRRYEDDRRHYRDGQYRRSDERYRHSDRYDTDEAYDSRRRRNDGERDRYARRENNRHRYAQPNDEAPPSKRAGYGLQGDRKVTTGILGPDPTLLKEKRRQRQEEIDRNRQLSSTRRHRTPEERAAALRAMEMDAKRKQPRRRSRSPSPDQGQSTKHPNFLRDMQRKAHGLDGNQSLQERLTENRNASQMSRGNDFL